MPRVPLKYLPLLIPLLTASIASPIAAFASTHATENETLYAQRILELYSDKEIDMAIREGVSFLKLFPESSLCESVHAVLADSYFQRKQYRDASRFYRNLENPKLIKSTFSNRVRTHLRLAHYKSLFHDEKRYLPPIEASEISLEEQFFAYTYGVALLEENDFPKNPKVKKHLTTIAEKRLLQVTDPPLATDAQQRLAALYKTQGRRSEAIPLYLALAELDANKKEDYLLKAAHLQAKVSPKEAIATLSRILQIKGPKQSEAAVLKAKTLFTLKQYSQLISESKDLKSVLSESHKPLFDYYLSESLFAKKAFNKTIDLLSPHISTETTFLNSPPLKQRIHLLMAASSFETGDIEKGNRWLNAFETLTPQDDHLVKLLSLQGKAYRKQQQTDETIDSFQRALEIADSSTKNALRSRRASLLISLADAYHAKKEYPQAIDFANEALDATTSMHIQYKAHLLLSRCYQKDPAQNEKQITHAEKALELNPDAPQAAALHHGLFRSYAILLERDASLEKETPNEFLAKASYHFQKAFSLKPDIATPKEHLWLANHTIKKIDAATEEYSITPVTNPLLEDIARQTLASYLFVLERDKTLDHPKRQSLQYQIGKLYLWTNAFDNATQTLESIVHAETAKEDPPSPIYFKSALTLAKLYEAQGEEEKALPLYREIISQKHAPKQLALMAKLHHAEAVLNSHNIDKDDTQVSEALHSLQTIAMQKELQTEPLHLEAALIYACYQAMAAPTREQESTYLKTLKQQKEEFTSEEDIHSKDYHHLRTLDPELDNIYQAYMLLIDAHILTIEAKAALKEGRELEASRAYEDAEHDYEKLHEINDSVYKLFREKGQEILKSLEQESSMRYK